MKNKNVKLTACIHERMCMYVYNSHVENYTLRVVSHKSSIIIINNVIQRKNNLDWSNLGHSDVDVVREMRVTLKK